jgi:hypothetical protein
MENNQGKKDAVLVDFFQRLLALRGDEQLEQRGLFLRENFSRREEVQWHGFYMKPARMSLYIPGSLVKRCGPRSFEARPEGLYRGMGPSATRALGRTHPPTLLRSITDFHHGKICAMHPYASPRVGSRALSSSWYFSVRRPQTTSCTHVARSRLGKSGKSESI